MAGKYGSAPPASSARVAVLESVRGIVSEVVSFPVVIPGDGHTSYASPLQEAYPAIDWANTTSTYSTTCSGHVALWIQPSCALGSMVPDLFNPISYYEGALRTVDALEWARDTAFACYPPSDDCEDRVDSAKATAGDAVAESCSNGIAYCVTQAAVVVGSVVVGNRITGGDQ